MDDYIDLPSLEGNNTAQDYINLQTETPERIQIIYEISKSIEDISTRIQEQP